MQFNPVDTKLYLQVLDVTWTWDPAKATANFRKHGVSFALAQRVFNDPFSLTRRDPFRDEERWQTVGMPFAGSPGVLLVVHTDQDGEGGRVISGRKATAHERKAYEKGEF